MYPTILTYVRRRLCTDRHRLYYWGVISNIFLGRDREIKIPSSAGRFLCVLLKQVEAVGYRDTAIYSYSRLLYGT
jgi:hypothetical protein